MNIIITMAGKSQRFKDNGYKLPKFLLSLGPKIIIKSVIECFSEEDFFHLIITKSQNEKFKTLYETLLKLTKNVVIHIIEDHGQGPVYSALLIMDKIPNQPFIINYCDFLVQWDYSKFKRMVSNFDLVIPTFT